jgi:arginase
MGRGPMVMLADDMAPSQLRDAGFDVEVTWVDADDPVDVASDQPNTFNELLIPGDQMSRHLIQDQAVSRLVSKARADRRTPIVFCGNCNTSLGILGGLAESEIGVVWLDAHADCETPETTLSGLFDGMALATVAGKCWERWRRSIPGFREVPEERIVFLGNHADPMVEPVGTALTPGAARATGMRAFAEALDGLRSKTNSIYMHIDFDIIDPSEGASAVYSAPGGLTVAEVAQAIGLVGERFNVLATGFSAFDPDVDERMPKIILRLLQAAAANVPHAGRT